jgi:hypothetical protein
VKPQVEPCYLFPSFDQEDDGLGGGETPRPYPRPRSRTGPSSKIPSWTDVSSIPPPRFSGSSTRTHYDTPPRTPVDIISSFRGYSVEVAAPVSGVETMDALVDGMNGGDDIMGSSMPSRARFGIPGHHPLYQPPLPTPPPGVILGGGKRRGRSRPSRSSTSDEEDSPPKRSSSPPTRRRQNRLPSSSRTASNSTITIAPSLPDSESEDVDPPLSNHTLNTISRRPVTAPVPERLRTVPPSISEIIRNHAPPEAQARSRPATSQSSSMYGSSQGHGTVYEEPESEPEPVTADEEAELMSRSSIDSIADEVRRTLRNQNVSTVAPPSLQHAHTFPKRYSILSDNASISSPRSDLGAEPSIYSSSAASSYPPSSPFEAPSFLTVSRPSPSQAVAQYLRSTRLTTLLKLTRSPHASHDNPLTVSLSDLGSPSGFPLVVFLGLGCVRHVMGLYDEMAECLGLRLITIDRYVVIFMNYNSNLNFGSDRWGLGRTEPRAKSSKGIMEWASVVEEVLDLLHIGQCSVMAHSAGAPYALSFANKLPNRIRGDICLLAPWVGGSESGKCPSITMTRDLRADAPQ